MLIVTSKAPGWGKLKPKQWGPLSAVRSAVFFNAERLGIDPALIMGYWPCWEGAGVSLADVANASISPAGTVGWLNRWAYFPTAGNGVNTGKPYSPNGMSFTFIQRFSTNSSPTVSLSNASGAGAQGYSIVRSTASAVFVRAHDGTGERNTPPVNIPYGQMATIAGVCFSGVELQKYVNGCYFSKVLINPGGTYSSANLHIGSRNLLVGIIGEVDYTAIFATALSAAIIAELHNTPYALLTPYTPPVYFDMGGGGSSSVTSDFATVYDIRALVNSDFATTYDLRQIASSDFAVAYDILQLVFSDFGTVYDIRQEVSSDYSVVFDVRGFTESDFAAVYDMAGRVFSDFTVTYDLGEVVGRVKITGRLRLRLGLRL